MEAGVLVEAQSSSNTPTLLITILIQKADKTKWGLVHDLRAVNEKLAC